MSNAAGAPLVMDATITGMSKDRVAELNRAYEQRIAAKKAEKEEKKAMKKGKRAVMEKKSSADNGARTLWEQAGYKFDV
jgi:ABC-type nitrate/sulfonate/bicarbonate transport system substrate-binding protein